MTNTGFTYFLVRIEQLQLSLKYFNVNRSYMHAHKKVWTIFACCQFLALEVVFGVHEKKITSYLLCITKMN